MLHPHTTGFRPSRSAVTGAVRRAMPETLDTECRAALAAARSPALHPMRVGIARGTVEVLGWVGHGGPEPPRAPFAGRADLLEYWLVISGVRVRPGLVRCLPL